MNKNRLKQYQKKHKKIIQKIKIIEKNIKEFELRSNKD